MGWMETCAVEERMRFVIAVREREEAFAAVCRQFGVSRRTGYRFLRACQQDMPSHFVYVVSGVKGDSTSPASSSP
jgi:transposase-like protein